MRTPKRSVNDDGSISYKVRFRLDGRDSSTTFSGHADFEREVFDKAVQFAKMVDALGPSKALDWQRQQDGDPEAVGPETVNEIVEDWIITRTRASEATRLGYRQEWARMFGPVLGHLPAAAVQWRDVAKAVNQLSTTGGRDGRGYAAKSLKKAFTTLSAAFDMAMRDEIVRRNPCDDVELPSAERHDRQDMYLFSMAEYYDLLDVVHPHYRPLVETLAGTGIRWGEAEALEVGDVDLDRAMLRITKAAKWNGSRGRREIGPPKTKHGKRTITLPPQTVEALRPLVERRKKRERLFTGPRGGPITHKTFWSTVWVPSMETLGLLDPRPRIHDLRHAHASWLIGENVPMPVVSRRLGHHSISVTVDIYGHLSPDIQRAAADAAQVVFSAGGRAAVSNRRALPGAGEQAAS